MILAVDLPYWAQSLLRLLGGTVAVLLPAGTIVYLYGSMQLFAEVGKWLQKEDIAPERADLRVFRAAPIVVLMSTFLLVAVVPFGPDAYFTNFDAGVFYLLAVSSISTLGILMAGWSSANKYSLLGGLRAAGQLIAYELPMVLAVLGVVIQAGSMNLQTIVIKQNSDSIFGWDGLGFPYILTQFVAFLVFMIAVQAELTQTPFDMPIAESELVSGYMTEYSGFRFTQVDNWMNLAGPLIMFTKMMVLTAIIMWVRFSYPRFREDQLQRFAWKVLIPVSLVNIMLTAIFKVAF